MLKPTIQKWAFSLSRFLAMRGSALPSNKDHRKYWETRNIGDDHGPEKYTNEDNSTYIMFEDLLKVLNENASFLEIGCNAGRNLNYLLNKGFTDLAGIEINETSIHKTLKEHFPKLYEVGQFYVGNAADEIRKIQDERYEVVFSIAVLEHIPPRDIRLFSDMVRVSKKYIAIITGENSRVYPYNFEKLFEKLGCKAVSFKLFYGDPHNFQLPREAYNEKVHFYGSMFLRIFVKSKKT
jgi:SAM-dependent methyltransferase